MTQVSEAARCLNQFQEVAERLRRKYEAEYRNAVSTKRNEEGSVPPEVKRLDWGRCVLQGFVDDLADADGKSIAEVRAFVTRRRDRLKNDGAPSVPACEDLLRALEALK